MRVVHLSTSDQMGGAARAAYRVHTGLRRLGVDSRMLVQSKISADPNVAKFVPRQDLLSKIRHKVRKRRIEADFAPVKANKPPRYELFTDDRTEYAGEAALQVPECD